MIISKKNLLSLPERKWTKYDEDAIYDALYIVPTGKKHDSEYNIIAIVGITYIKGKKEKMEIAGYADDLFFKYEEPPESGEQAFRIDSEYPSGIIHIWSWYHQFSVESFSDSREITLIKKRKVEENLPDLKPKGKFIKL